jgi:hypothetical protein
VPSCFTKVQTANAVDVLAFAEMRKEKMNSTQNRSTRLISLLFSLTLGLALFGCQKSDAAANQPEVFKNLPEQQKQFCLIREKIWKTGGSVSAEVKALLGPSGNFVGWRGVGSFRLQDYSNLLAVTFTPVCPTSDSVLYFETGKVGAEDTSVPIGNGFAKTLQTSDFSQGMIATGKLLRATDNSLIARFEMISPAHFFPSSNNVRSNAAVQSPAPSTNAASGSGLTDQQVQLCKLNHDFLNWQPPPQETNTIKMATAGPIREPDWNGKLQTILGDGTFTDWRAVIYSTLVNQYREVGVNVHFTCPEANGHEITLTTTSVDRIPWPHFRSAVPSSDVKIGSDISNLLSTMNQGDSVTVSGKIFYERRYVGDLLFPTVYDLRIGRQNMGASNLSVRFDKMSK